jgi:hypothetical protein
MEALLMTGRERFYSQLALCHIGSCVVVGTLFWLLTKWVSW